MESLQPLNPKTSFAIICEVYDLPTFSVRQLAQQAGTRALTSVLRAKLLIEFRLKCGDLLSGLANACWPLSHSHCIRYREVADVAGIKESTH